MSMASIRDLVANHMTVDRDKIVRRHESLWHCNDYPFMDLRLNGDVSFASTRNPL
jgi:N-acetylmuramoyl-L-alanine amidase CwlA